MIVKCEAVYFPVTEVNKEKGKFNIDGKEIIGYRIESSDESNLTLTWNLPESKQDMISTLEKTKWKNDYVSYDDFDCDADSYNIRSFNEDGGEIDEDDYQEIDFDGDCNLELEYFEVDNSLDHITLFDDDEDEIVISPNDFSSHDDFIFKVKELCD